MINFGPVPIGAVLPIPFDTFAGATGASITMTGLAVTDIEVYKGTSMTQRSSDAGYVLMDTDGIDIDTITGIHGFSIDTGDNTDAGFYASGSFYTVVVSAVTVDSQTVNFIAATFRCVTAETVAGQPKVDVAAVAGTAQTAGDLAAQIALVKVVTDKLGATFRSAGTLDAGTTSSFTLPSGQRSGVIAGQAVILITSGAAIGECQQIASYTVGTGVGAPANNFAATPGTATYVVIATPGSVALVAADFGAGSLNGKGDWNVGKTGYSLTATTGLGNQTADITGTITTTTNLTNLPTIPANWLTTAGITDGAFTAAKFAASSLNGKGDWNVGKTGYALTATTGLGNQTANITGNLSGSVGSVTGAVGSVTGAVGSVTAAVALTSAYDFAKGTTAMTEAYAANGVAPTPVQAIMGIHQMLMQFGIASTSYTVKKLDNATTAFIVTLDSATAPTAAART